MPDILHDFAIQKDSAKVFEAISQPTFLDQWWTLRSSGQPISGGKYEFDFGPGFLWEGLVMQVIPGAFFEFKMTVADSDWLGTLIGFQLKGEGPGTRVSFYHQGWRETNDHFRITCHCWGLYLRLLRRLVETGEVVPYHQRQMA